MKWLGLCFLFSAPLRAETRILFCGRTATAGSLYDLYTMRADGTDFAPLTATPTISEWSPALAPDGVRLAFVDVSLTANNLRVMNLMGGAAVTAPIAGRAHSVQWIDNATLAYIRQSTSTTAWQLYRVKTDGTAGAAIYPTVYRSFFTGVDSFHVHRSTGRVYFGASTNPPNLAPGAPHSGLLSAAAHDIVFTRGTDALAAGEGAVQGTTLIDHYDMNVSPDATKIAYCADHGSGYHRLYVRNNAAADTASQVRVCDTYCGDPDWSPDGTWLAFTRAAASSLGSVAYVGNITRVSPTGTGLTNLTAAHATIAGRAAHPLIYDTPVFAPPDFQITQAARNAGTGAVTLTWPVSPAFIYQLRYSDDMTVWRTDLPNSSRTAGPLDTSMNYTDTPPAGTMRRYYQVVATAP